MPTESIRVSGLIPATPKQIYDAWLDAQAHSKFSGGKATVEPYIGGKYTAFDQAIRGETIELDPGKRIVQSWKTPDFPKGVPASRVEVTFGARKGIGTEITFVHTGIPEGLGQRAAESWLDKYVTPMRRYFGNLAAKKAAAKEAAANPPAPAEAKKSPPETKKAPAAKPAEKKPAKPAKPSKPANKKAAKPAKKPANKKAAKPAKKPANKKTGAANKKAGAAKKAAKKAKAGAKKKRR